MAAATAVAVAVAFVTGGGGTAGLAHADAQTPCAAEGEPWVRFEAGSLAAPARGRVLVQLRAAMRERKIGLCGAEDAPAGDPMAVLELSPAGGESVAVVITVRDAVTDKRLARDVDLRAMPEDSRPLILALAAEELLRASWAELVMVDPPPPPRLVPPQVIAAVERPPPLPVAPAMPRFEIGAAAVAEHFGGGLDAFGGDAVAKLWPWPRIGGRAHVGFRQSTRASVPDGDVRASGIELALGPAFALLPRDLRGGVDVFADAIFTHMTFIAEPRTAARASDEGGSSFYLSAGAGGWYALLPSLHVFVEGALGAPVHTVRIAEDDSSITGLFGVYLAARAGLAGAL